MVIRTIGHRTHTVTGEESTLSETIRQRPIGAGCWRFLHANDDKVSACGFRNDVRSRHVLFRPAVWLFREFSVRIINMNGHLCMIDFRSQPEPIFIPFKQLLPNRFPFTRSEVASFGMSHDEKSRQCTRIFTGNSTDSISVAASEIHSSDDVNLLSLERALIFSLGLSQKLFTNAFVDFGLAFPSAILIPRVLPRLWPTWIQICGGW